MNTHGNELEFLSKALHTAAAPAERAAVKT